jgi:hypothetical protein
LPNGVNALDLSLRGDSHSYKNVAKLIHRGTKAVIKEILYSYGLFIGVHPLPTHASYTIKEVFSGGCKSVT